MLMRPCCLIVFTLLVIALSQTSAAQQYDTSYDCPCLDGNCPTNTANFGYYQTGWRRWPTSAPASSFARPAATRTLDSLPAAELPDPRFEGDVAPPVRRPEPATPTPTPNEVPQLPSIDAEPSLPPFELPSPEPVPDRSMNQPLPSAEVRTSVATNTLPSVPKFHLIASQSVQAPTEARPLTLRNVAHVETTAEHDSSEPVEIKPITWDNPLRTASSIAPKLTTQASSPPRRIDIPVATKPLPTPEETKLSPQRQSVEPVSQATLSADNPLRPSSAANPLRDEIESGDGELRNPLR